MMLSTFKYLSLPLRLDQYSAGGGFGILEELPLYGVYFEERINGIGQFTATIQLTGDQYLNDAYEYATRPGARVIWVIENGIPLQAYIIWTRTYQAASRTLQMTGQTYESYLYKNFARQNYELNNFDQAYLFGWIWDTMQSISAERDVAVKVGSIDPTTKVISEGPGQYPNTGVTRTLTSYQAEFNTFGDLWDELIEYDNSADSNIRLTETSNLGWIPYLHVGYPKLGRSPTTCGYTFDYPGSNVSNFWVSDNAAKAVNKAWATGADDGWATTQESADKGNTWRADEGQPLLEQRWVFRGTRSSSRLQSKATSKLSRYQAPVRHLTLELNPAAVVNLSDMQVGDQVYFNVAIDQPYLAGWQKTVRLLGWNCTVGDGDVPERIEIVTKDDDLA